MLPKKAQYANKKSTLTPTTRHHEPCMPPASRCRLMSAENRPSASVLIPKVYASGTIKFGVLSGNMNARAVTAIVAASPQ